MEYSITRDKTNYYKKTKIMKKVFFQSSLPRSGSTLLQNIMGQNPNFYVTPTSGVLELLYAARANYTNSPEFKAQDPRDMELGFIEFCRSGLKGFYSGITNKPYIIDKSRGWGIHYNFLNTFYPEPKIICMVRDIRSILSSMEKIWRKNQLKDSGIVDHQNLKGTTTEKRIDVWLNSQPIGLALERLYQIIKEGNDQHILFIKFEDLTRNPALEIRKIYEFLDVKDFDHDYRNIEQITKEDDTVYGIYGDHKIQKEVKSLKEDYEEILGKNASDWVYNNFKWFYEKFNY